MRIILTIVTTVSKVLMKNVSRGKMRQRQGIIKKGVTIVVIAILTHVVRVIDLVQAVRVTITTQIQEIHLTKSPARQCNLA